MDKDLKRSIKRDELVEGVESANAWAHTYGHELKVAAAVVAGVLLLGGGMVWYRQSRASAADQAFVTALETYHAEVPSPGVSPTPGAQTFATSQEKLQKSAAAFDEVAKSHGSTPSGKRARYYAALARIEMGQTAEAEKELAELASEDSSSLDGALARLALADAHRRAGQLDKAIDGYRKLADDAKLAMPRDYALMQLAAVLEEAKRHGEAAASYKRLAQEYPESAFAAQARRRADMLDTSAS